jgi:hypothetical protein
MRPARTRPALWAPRGFAAIPTAALDPPLGAALLRSPRLSGLDPHARHSAAVVAGIRGSSSAMAWNSGQVFRAMLRQPADDPSASEQPSNVAASPRELQVVDAVGLLDTLVLERQSRQLTLRPRRSALRGHSPRARAIHRNFPKRSFGGTGSPSDVDATATAPEVTCTARRSAAFSSGRPAGAQCRHR